MLKIQTLSSGSKGNITFIGSDTVNILVDIGLSLPQTLKRLQAANIDPKSIGAILVTHEHSDHIAGVASFTQKYSCPVYCHKHTKKILKEEIGIGDEYFEIFEDSFTIGDISVTPFPIPHDSRFCFGYTFAAEGSTVGIATDVGEMTDIIMANLAQCQIIVLECNHDKEKLIANTKYPVWLKRRILSARGHLSNTECCRTVLQLQKYNAQQIILAHISQENNSPALAYNTVKQFLLNHNITEGQDIYIDVAAQDEIGNLYCID
jgi:phosphoribosyl 1,2-cyclic phosphodiesterase